MNKIKQNKITFTLILGAIIVIFSSISILCLPVLFNYKSKVTIIEKNFYKNFKIFLNTSGKISYKPFPKPHLLVENASLNFDKSIEKNNFIDTRGLKIFISLRDVYLRSFSNLVSAEISNSNLEFQISDLQKIRKHLYQKVNNAIEFNNCKIFLKNEKEEVIIISPLKKILYKINNKSKTKNLIINGEIFGFNFKSEWKRNYSTPKFSFHNIKIFNPNIEIKNILDFEDIERFKANSQIVYAQDKLEYNFVYKNKNILISSPESQNTNFNINSEIQLNPFSFNGELTIKNKKVENILDTILLNLLLYNENYLGNLNGALKIKFDEMNNKLIKDGELDFIIKEKKINLQKANFNLGKIGIIQSNISFIEHQGETKFFSKNHLIVNNHIEFAKVFQIGTKKTKNIKSIYFNLEKDIGETDVIISNVRVNDKEIKNNKLDKFYLVKNIQNLRAYIRNIID